ncbi:MAG: ABC transporter permease [Anaerolineae bacterium]
MNIWESYRISLRSLGANKMRSGLTMLGVIIGVAAVIALLAVGQGAGAAITQQVQGIGSNLIFVVPGSFQQNGMRSSAGTAATLTLADADALGKSDCCSGIAEVAPVYQASGQVVFGGNNTSTSVTGTTADFPNVRNFHVAFGRFIEPRDDDTLARVAVLGSDTAKNLFGRSDPLGQTIKINRVPFKVIGVMETKGGGGMFGGSQDDVIFVPIRTAQIRLFGTQSLTPTGQHRVSVIYASARTDKAIDVGIQQMTLFLRERHHIQFQQDDFSVLSQKDILGALSQITSILTIFLASIAAISLLVGGIGIMNIMLVSVTERTREIGIRKAVGARRRDILLQFLIEAVSLSVSGGILGILLGAGIAEAVTQTGIITTVVDTGSVSLAVGFSMGVGLFFGLYPAWRASLLHPIDALRYE